MTLGEAVNSTHRIVVVDWLAANGVWFIGIACVVAQVARWQILINWASVGVHVQRVYQPKHQTNFEFMLSDLMVCRVQGLA